MPVVNYFGKTVAQSGASTIAFSVNSLVNGTATGTTGNDVFTVGNGAYTLAGGAGDDVYYSVSSQTKIVENPGGGIDTVHVISNYVMPANVENLVVGYAQGVVGNDLDNYIVGNASSQSIEGGKGNDVLTGGGGGDSFVFKANSGYDVITDFHPGASATATVNPDTVQLGGYAQFKTLADVTAAMTQVGSDVILKLDDSDAIKFLNTKVSDFTKDNFLLKFDPSGLKMTFDEEFNGPLDATGGASASKFRTDYGWGGDSNAALARTLTASGEKEIYVDPALTGSGSTALGLDPFSVNDGVLTIHAGPDSTADASALYGYQFTSGLLSTRNSFTQTYGYFETRMELPAGSGAWPAFWLYTTGSSGSELDVEESHSSDSWTATTHDYSTGKDVPLSSTVFTPDLSTGYHTYGVLWTAQTVTWYLDGVAVRSEATPADMHGPMYLIVNLALDSSTAPTFSGADLKVDYIHAYSLDSVPAGITAAATAIGTGNTVTGGSGADSLNDTAGASTLVGGAGNDKYFVSSATTKIVENAGEGTDTVYASIDYTLPANVENIVLTGNAVNATGNELDNKLTGDDLANTLTGGAGNDTLDGGKGADTLIGGTGNDTYYVDNVGDQVVENPGEGTDTVIASVDYTLPANVENLTLTGTATHATGNELDNIITADDAGDVLSGGAGNDRLVSGKGVDTLVGGTGNDTYVVNNSADVIVEKANEGWDAIVANVDYVAPANVEQLTLAGTATHGTANDQGMYLTGNDLGDTLTGGKGNDTIKGGAGNDTIIGGAGNDTLTGGGGKDVFVFTPGAGKDVITDFTIGTDRIDWSAYTTAGVTPTIADVAGVATVKLGSDTITFTGLHASDLIAAGVFAVAAPVLTPTTPVVTPVTPVVTPTAPTATPVAPIITPAAPVITPADAATTYTLSATTTSYTLTGSITHAVGNDLANLLIGGSLTGTLEGGGGNDTLIAGKAAETLIGGTGNDWYSVNNTADVVVEKTGEGVDTISSSVDYTLPANVENLVLTGTAIHGTGNDLGNAITGNDQNNVLTGGAGNDHIDGGKGADLMTGGAGNDTYIVDNPGDVVVEKPGGGTDIIFSSVDYTAPANIEQLTLTGTATHGTANDQGMTLLGNDLGDRLTGGKGNDVIIGGKGNDIIIGGGGSDRLTGGGGADTFVLTAGFGKEVITDFDVNADKIDWSALTAKFGAPTLKDSGANVVASFGSDMVTFLGVHAADLTSHHIFG